MMILKIHLKFKFKVIKTENILKYKMFKIRFDDGFRQFSDI